MSIVVEVVSIGVCGAVVAGVVVYNVKDAVGEARVARRVARTRARVHEGADVLLDATAADPTFDPDITIGCVHELLAVADAIWHRREPALTRPGADVVRAWAAQITAVTGLAGKPRIGVLDVINRTDPAEARVVLRVTLRVQAQRISRLEARTTTLDTRWVLARADTDWQPVEIAPYSGEAPTRSFVARPSDDIERLHESALTELARTDAAATGIDELLSADTPAQQALLELSVIDGRYTPALLEAALNHILQAWEAATTGSHEPLEQIADQAAIDRLLHRDHDGQHLSIIADDLELRSWTAIKLIPEAQPPIVVVRLTIHGILYRTTESGTLLPGDQATTRDGHLWWALSPTDDATTQWRLRHVITPTHHHP